MPAISQGLSKARAIPPEFPQTASDPGGVAASRRTVKPTAQRLPPSIHQALIATTPRIRTPTLQKQNAPPRLSAAYSPQRGASSFAARFLADTSDTLVVPEHGSATPSPLLFWDTVILAARRTKGQVIYRIPCSAVYPLIGFRHPKGAKCDSPGQRSGFNDKNIPSPEGAQHREFRPFRA